MASENYLVGQTVKFIGGKYNGFFGDIRWLGDSSACVIVIYENKPMEIIEDLIFLMDLVEWKRGKSFTELALKPSQ